MIDRKKLVELLGEMLLTNLELNEEVKRLKEVLVSKSESQDTTTANKRVGENPESTFTG